MKIKKYDVLVMAENMSNKSNLTSLMIIKEMLKMTKLNP